MTKDQIHILKDLLKNDKALRKILKNNNIMETDEKYFKLLDAAIVWLK